MFSKRFWSFECNISSFCVCHHFYCHCALQYVSLLENFFDILLIVSLLVVKKYIVKNIFSFRRIKTIHLFTKPIIITSPIGFNIALNNINATLKQRWYNVASRLCNAVSTLRNVVLTLFQRLALTLYRHCARLKIRRRILFHF